MYASYSQLSSVSFHCNLTLSDVPLSTSIPELAEGVPASLLLRTIILSSIKTVSGSTTTVNTETILLADNIIVLNSNETGTPSANAGIEVERGTSDNVKLQWNETDDNWEYDAYNHASDPALVTYKIPRTYAATIGDASNTSYAVTHNLGTKDVIVQIYDISSNDTVFADVVRTNSATVTLTFGTAPALNDIRVLISTVG